MKYMRYNDQRGYGQVVEFSKEELKLFDKNNPTLFSICMYISQSGILLGSFDTLDRRRKITLVSDIKDGCIYWHRGYEFHDCPIFMFFGRHIHDAVCANSTCRMSEDCTCCLERTWGEAMGRQGIVDYAVHSMGERIQRLKDSIKIHQGIKVV